MSEEPKNEELESQAAESTDKVEEVVTMTGETAPEPDAGFTDTAAGFIDEDVPIADEAEEVVEDIEAESEDVSVNTDMDEEQNLEEEVILEEDFMTRLLEISDDALRETFSRMEPRRLARGLKGMSQDARRRIRSNMPEEMRETLDDTLKHVEPVSEIAREHTFGLMRDLMNLWRGEVLEDEDLDAEEAEEIVGNVSSLSASETLEWMLAFVEAKDEFGNAVYNETMEVVDDPLMHEGLSLLSDNMSADRLKMIMARRKKAELIEAERKMDIIEAAIGMIAEGAKPAEIRKVCEAFLPYDA